MRNRSDGSKDGRPGARAATTLNAIRQGTHGLAQVSLQVNRGKASFAEFTILDGQANEIRPHGLRKRVTPKIFKRAQ